MLFPFNRLARSLCTHGYRKALRKLALHRALRKAFEEQTVKYRGRQHTLQSLGQANYKAAQQPRGPTDNVQRWGHHKDALTLSHTTWEVYPQQRMTSFRFGCTVTALSERWTLFACRKFIGLLTTSMKFLTGVCCTQGIQTRMEDSRYASRRSSAGQNKFGIPTFEWAGYSISACAWKGLHWMSSIFISTAGIMLRTARLCLPSVSLCGCASQHRSPNYPVVDHSSSQVISTRPLFRVVDGLVQDATHQAHCVQTIICLKT